MAVRDIEASKVFYEKPGFTAFGGNQSQNWLILKNGDHVIGLFQGMFEKNLLTFTRAGVRMLGRSEASRTFESCLRLKADGVSLMTEADESSTGPASFMVVDPDGNTILVDQHV